jgi:pimeloyl-ACP methyl ester carboxylesterase
LPVDAGVRTEVIDLVTRLNMAFDIMAESAASHPIKNTSVRTLVRAGITTGVSWLGRRSPVLGSIAAESLFLSPTRHARPAWEASLLAEARAFSVAYAGHQLPAWEWGDGPTILLLHGWEGRGSQLGAFVDPLVRAGHRVVTLDLPGHGDAHDARVSVLDFAHVITQVHPALWPIHGVIAHSMGAAASTLAYTLSPFAARMVLIAAPRSPRRFFDAFVHYLELDTHTSQATEQRLEQRYTLALDEIDTLQFAPFVSAQALVIHDRDDREVPFEHGRLLASALPHATLFETHGLGHRRILKDDEVIRTATEFVASPDAKGVAARLDAELFDRELRVDDQRVTGPTALHTQRERRHIDGQDQSALHRNRDRHRRPQRPHENSDGVVEADLSVPKELGGPGKPGAATPEHLFAAGYAACFGGALDFVAKLSGLGPATVWMNRESYAPIFRP